VKYLLVSFLLLIPTTAFASTLALTHVQHAIGVVLMYLSFCGWIFWRHKRRAAQYLLDKNFINTTAQMRDENSVLVTYASQTGNAEQLAQRTAQSLNTAGLTVELRSFLEVDATKLKNSHHVLFVVSTTGEGDAPDNAHNFLTQVMHQDADYSNLQYGILALGDSSYTKFCGFGHALDAWLRHSHAIPLFDLVEVDKSDDGALRHWQSQLGILANNTEMADWKTPHYHAWKLNARTLLNKGSAGSPVFHLRLTSQDSCLNWHAGDIAEIGPQNSQQAIDRFLEYIELDGARKLNASHLTLREALQDKLLPHDNVGFKEFVGLSAEDLVLSLKVIPHREYSIASIPQDGGIELLVRQSHYPDGRLGIGSGWLTEYAAVNGHIGLRIRQNNGFHSPSNHLPLILIGNGTGIAGLIAHLKARAYLGHGDNWLIFGERNAAYDFYFKSELLAWRDQGLLTKLDVAFSRDQSKKCYVQDVVREMHADILKWVNDGAAIYICGSARGMAPAVHHELLEILGEALLSTLADAGRYRRDVY
jgi:sulfite reductase (NADPH) flavoprotein alpha-component